MADPSVSAKPSSPATSSEYEFRLYPPAQRPRWAEGMPVYMRTSSHGNCRATVVREPAANDDRVELRTADDKVVSVRQSRVEQVRWLCASCRGNDSAAQWQNISACEAHAKGVNRAPSDLVR